MIESVEDLRALIREVDASIDPPADPWVVADKVIGQLTEPEMRVALTVSLPGWASDLLRRDRDRTLRDIPADQGHPAVGGEQTTGAEQAAQDRDVTQSRLGAARYLSPFIAAWHQRAMRTRFYTYGDADTDGAWKRYGDLTPDDLDTAADARDSQAAALHAEAERWRWYARTMREHGWRRICEIPPEEFRSMEHPS